MHSEMGPVRQNPIHRTVRTAHLSVLMTVHNFKTQYNTEQFWYLPSYLQATIITQMLSTGGKGGMWREQLGLTHLYPAADIHQALSPLLYFIGKSDNQLDMK